MTICACGCGNEIPYKPWHKQHPPRFIHGHNTLRGEHLWARSSNRRLPPEGIPCACGCGGMVTECKSNGQPRYPKHGDKLYLPNHRPRGEDHHLWKGGHYKNSSGYIFIYLPEHPRANKDGCVLEHRYVWEQFNGRLLKTNEVVHHINGVRDDNRIENLIVLTKNKHSSLHVKERGGIPTTPESVRRAGRLGAKARWG